MTGRKGQAVTAGDNRAWHQTANNHCSNDADRGKGENTGQYCADQSSVSHINKHAGIQDAGNAGAFYKPSVKNKAQKVDENEQSLVKREKRWAKIKAINENKGSMGDKNHIRRINHGKQQDILHKQSIG